MFNNMRCVRNWERKDKHDSLSGALMELQSGGEDRKAHHSVIIGYNLYAIGRERSHLRLRYL